MLILWGIFRFRRGRRLGAMVRRGCGTVWERRRNVLEPGRTGRDYAYFQHLWSH